MDTHHSRQAREATSQAVLDCLRSASETGMMPAELTAALPSMVSRTVTRALSRLIDDGLVRRDSERGRVYALPVREDGSPVTAEDIAAEAAAQHARFLAQRDSDVVKVETAARIDLRKLDPRLRHIATGRSTYLLRFAETLRQCNTQSAYDAVSHAFDTDFTEIEAKWTQANLELQQEKDRQNELEKQQKAWEKARKLETKQHRALPAGNTRTQTWPVKTSKKRARFSIRKDWQPVYGQVLLPQPAPANATLCKFCRPPYPSPIMYWVAGELFPAGIGLCDRHAEQERYGPNTQVYGIAWS